MRPCWGNGCLPKFLSLSLFVLSEAARPCKGCSGRTRRSRAFPWVCPRERREFGQGVFGRGEPTSPWKRREWLGVGLYNGQASMGHPQPGFQHGWLPRPAPARRGRDLFQPSHSFSPGKRSGSATGAGKAGSSGWWSTGRFTMSASFPRDIPGADGLSATMLGRTPR